MRKKIYLDYAAATPVDPRVMKVMKPYFSEKFGNTMSLHSFGQEGREVLEKSREAVAGSIKARPKEIIFTSSATESNNLALKGVAFANQEKGRHIIISPIEHPCVLESANWLAKSGFKRRCFCQSGKRQTYYYFSHRTSLRFRKRELAGQAGL
ncbi:MAG: hypothetical protein A3E90_03120 [Candidatus Portnoybacteria bacterium RIFCSPHIGHO2_12_FULL_40_11]|uniref:Aminotransferase class V domain-containing protein n=1 Tax=Candidatus Portnoybacteria bacterium RIFCSPHIGHO2_12_FULL_40_11 TaxID=1801998 RepID=A0A1G2FNM9_9BACT|nr:MAG: hypothetical protein A3E90_03120 [Candidatus Portnoybacteria bacterium RIFCSPHIGHO2_12_FULL_40_11]